MVFKKKTMAIVRASRPNLAEFSIYRPFLDQFDLTFFFAGIDPVKSRAQLDAFGLSGANVVRYTSFSDLFPSQSIQRGLDYKIGIGTSMLTHLRDVLAHDYINVVDPIFAHTYQISRRMRPGQKLIIIRWENIYGRYDRVWMAAHRAEPVLKRADTIICVSRAAVSTLQLPPDFSGRVVQIYPGIDMRGLPSNGHGAAGRTSASHLPAILFVGRLQWTKGLQTLLVAMQILRQSKKLNVELWVIGGGDQAPFRALARRLSLQGQVSFLGVLANSEVRAKMAEASVFCFPSLLSPNWMEQYGFAVVEAMAHKLPIVAFDSGSIREICGEDAIYASTGNAHSLAESIAQSIEKRSDSQLRGKRLQERASREYDAETQGKKMLEAIESCSLGTGAKNG